jgi:serine/threonine-protein kinase HipA
VYCKGELAGSIRRKAYGATFQYAASFLETHEEVIAFHLPLTKNAIETRGVNLHPFFAGLLPEGYRLEALLRRLKSSKDDLLSMLVAAGFDCIGDISVVPEGKLPTAEGVSADLGRLSELSFAALLKESIASLGVHPLANIPGVQEKVSASMISFPVRSKRHAGDYILKLNPRDKPTLVKNEFFFLRVARSCGLEVAKTELVRDKEGASGLLVERFDRVRTDGGVEKIHQEDGCQFLDRYPADKYAVSAADIARGLAAVSTTPVVDILAWVRWIGFAYLIGNGDLHAKNVSVLRTPQGRVGISPAYDVLSTLPYGDRSLALKVDGRDSNLKRAGLVSFAERFGVRKVATLAMLDELCDGIVKHIDDVGDVGLPAKATSHLARVVAKRREDLGATTRR